MDPQAPDLSEVDASLAARDERKRAHDIVMKEYRRLKSQPLYRSTIAERQRQLNLLDRLAKRIKG